MNILTRSLLISATCFSIHSTHASANTLITFDDLAPGTSGHFAIPNGYAGFNWSNFYVENASLAQQNPSGYGYGTITPQNVAYNGYGDPASILTAVSGAGFGLVSGYFTGAWNNGLTVTASGTYESGATITTSFIVSATSPTLEHFNWADLASVTFRTAGGTPAGFIGGGQGTQFVLDNLSVSTAKTPPVPIPPSVLMFATGLLGLGAFRKKKVQVQNLHDTMTAKA